MFCLFVSRMTSSLYSFKKLMVCFVSPKWLRFKSLASCTTCLSVYVNLVKELLSLLSWLKCRFLASAPLKTCWPRGLFSKASAKVVSFCDTTKCFANYFSFLCAFLWFLIDGRWFGLSSGVIILVFGERERRRRKAAAQGDWDTWGQEERKEGRTGRKEELEGRGNADWGWRG